MSECIEWEGRKNRDGYGYMSISRKTWGVPRVAWTIANGFIPEGLQVLHKCDNRACVNVDHLFLGTNADNVKDRDNKGRQAKNEFHSRTVLSQIDVFMMRKAYRTGLISYSELGGLYGISRSHAYRVVVNERRQGARLESAPRHLNPKTQRRAG